MRDRVLMTIISALFFLLVVSLFYGQVLRYGYYSKLSRNNSIRVLPIEGPRGNIFDRTGQPLVVNRLSFNAAIIYQEIGDRRKLARLLSDVLGMTGEEIIRAFEKAGKRAYSPVTIAEDINKDEALALEEASFDVRGLLIETRAKRDYLYGHYGSHIFGYLSEITEKELEALKDYDYGMKDLIGRDGIEKYYESFLKGTDGGTQIEVDSRGRQMRVLGIKEPEGGQDLQLTIDLPLQLVCDKLLGDHKGTIVVMDPSNGDVLALASHPAFDPNIFVKRGTSRDRLSLLNDRAGRPMSNRAISGTFPPGSIFKIVTASAALEQKKITRNTRFFCSGTYRLGNSNFDCWKTEGGHGSQNVVEGMMNSCNVFFYSSGRALGVDRMEAYTKLFGYGRPTGIDLPDEVGGVVPGRAWKTSRNMGAWYEGETLNYSIGQGYLSVTPIQAAVMSAVMANNGNLVHPRLVKRIGANDIQPQKPKSLGLKDDTIRDIRAGLFEVINNENGTGKRARAAGVMAAGKTGTAQTQGRTHAWFCGFAPYSDPKICLVVFLEHGGKGGLEPAAIARGVFEEAKAIGYL